MSVTPVRALDAFKPGWIGGVANNPVPFWILRTDLADSILGERLTFLLRRLLIKVLYKELCIIASYRIIVFSPDYEEGNGHDDADDDQGCRS